MSTTIEKVILVGAAGSVGSLVLNALISAPFTVTILTRPESFSQFKSNVPVIRCAYDVASLKDAFTGQDAVVCCIGIQGLQYEKAMIDAAAAVGVKRFIIDEFANSPNQVGLPDLEFARLTKRDILKHAKQIADETDGFTWSALATGNFIDYVCQKSISFTMPYSIHPNICREIPFQALTKHPVAMGFFLPTHHAQLMDSGNEPFTATTLAGIAASVSGILKHPYETANRFCHVYSIRTSQNDILLAFECATGKKWTVEHLNSKDVLARGREKLKMGDRKGTLDVLTVQLFEEGTGRSIVISEDESDNALLGVPQETIHEIVHQVLVDA